jgi:hypothetical protein
MVVEREEGGPRWRGCNFCMLGGLPNGMAVEVDEVGPQAVSPFQFENDLSAFTMDQTVIHERSRLSEDVQWERGARCIGPPRSHAVVTCWDSACSPSPRTT